MPVSRPGHPTAVGAHLILDIAFNTIQFFEITSAVKRYGKKMVRTILTSILEDWEAMVFMDWSVCIVLPLESLSHLAPGQTSRHDPDCGCGHK
jgi:hypothetical protein